MYSWMSASSWFRGAGFWSVGAVSRSVTVVPESVRVMLGLICAGLGGCTSWLLRWSCIAAVGLMSRAEKRVLLEVGTSWVGSCVAGGVLIVSCMSYPCFVETVVIVSSRICCSVSVVVLPGMG